MKVKPCALSAARTNRLKPSATIGAEASRSAVRRVSGLLELRRDMARSDGSPTLRVALVIGKGSDCAVLSRACSRHTYQPTQRMALRGVFRTTTRMRPEENKTVEQTNASSEITQERIITAAASDGEEA